MLTVTRSDLRNAQAIVVTYDVSKRESFDNALHWMKEMDRFCARPLPLKMLLGCQADRGGDNERKGVPTSEAKDVAQQLNIFFEECSADTGANVENAFRSLSDACIERARKKMRRREERKKKRERSTSVDGCCALS